ncbi:MAG: YihY/virulence factor BrkB family protein [Acidimicrobiia bacterium]
MTSTARSYLSRLQRSTVVQILAATYRSWRADRAIRMGASLAYYALFAVVPLLSMAAAIAGLIFTETEIKEFLADLLDTFLNTTDLEATAADLAEAIDTSAAIGSLTLLGVAVGLFAASLLFVALQDSFNMIWDIPVGRGLRYKLRRRITAFAVVAMTGALLIASISIQAIALLLDELFPGQLPAVDRINDLFITLGTGALGIVALALLFQLLISHHLDWRHVFVVSAITGGLLIVGTWLLSLYFKHWGSTSVTGVLGSIMLLLAWFYYLSQIVIAGAELLKTLDRGWEEPTS